MSDTDNLGLPADDSWLNDFEGEVITGEPAWESEEDAIVDVDIIEDNSLAVIPFRQATLDINGTEPLDADQAKELTEYIRSTSNVLYVLIERAHSGKAHLALGYTSFEEYVKAEFDISRSRAYQLLNQSRVISEIESALPEGTSIHITEAAARDLKHALDDLVPEIRERTADLSPDIAGDVLEELVAKYRDSKLTDDEDELDDLDDDAPAYTGSGDGTYQGGDDFDDEDLLDDDELDSVLAFDDDPEEVRKNYKLVYELYATATALSNLATVTDIQKLIDIIPPERRYQIEESLPTSLSFLTRFSEIWNSQPWKDEVNTSEETVESLDELNDLEDLDDDFTDIEDDNI